MYVHLRLVFDSSLVCSVIGVVVSVVGGVGGQVGLVVCNAFKSLISEWYYGMRLLPRAPLAPRPARVPRAHLLARAVRIKGCRSYKHCGGI